MRFEILAEISDIDTFTTGSGIREIGAGENSRVTRARLEDGPVQGQGIAK
jgi:hypothetical protein